MESWKDFLTWEKATKDTIDFKKMYVDMIGCREAEIGIKKDKKGNIVNGDIVTGLLLSQIVYWYLPSKNNKTKLREKRFGHHWIVKERDEWWEEIRLTESNYKTSIKRLEDEQLIFKEVFKPAVFGHTKTATCIRLNIEEFLKRMKALMEYQKSLIQEDNDSEDDEFEKYLEEQFEEAASEEIQEESGMEESANPNGDMGMVESTVPKEWSNQPILRNGEIDHSKGLAESTDLCITEITSETLNKDFNRDLNLNPSVVDKYDILWDLQIPKTLKNRIKVKMDNKIYDLNSEQLLLIEEAYNYQKQQGNVIPDCDNDFSGALNDFQFSNSVEAMLDSVKEIENMRGSIQHWVLLGISKLIEIESDKNQEFEGDYSNESDFMKRFEDEDMPY